MNPADRLLVAIATYNEIESLPNLVRKLRLIAPEAELLVVDDNSPDGTGRWAQQQATEDRRMHCIIRPDRLGLGTAAVAAFQFALEHQFTWLATLDADGSHDPVALPEMVACLRAATPPAVDCVIGSRYVSGGQVEGWTWRRRVASQLVNRFSRAWLRLATCDNSTAFRVYRVATLARLNPKSLRSRGYAYLEEILWRLRSIGARVIEVPVTFRDRLQGRSKLSCRVALQKLCDLARIPWSKT